jgi:hypothetical protein
MFKKAIIGKWQVASGKWLAIAFLAINSYAASPAVWRDGEFLFFSFGKAYIAPADFCFALRYENEKIGNPVCSYAGDWERDSTVALYAKWLSANLDARLNSEDLRPRNQLVAERIRSLKDKSLLFSTIRSDSVWFLLFEENSAEPSKISVFSLKEDSAKIAKKIASSWFGSSPERRLSDEERAAKASEPDAYFAEQPKNDFWFGIGAGWSRAKIPLTPDSWYRRTFNSEVRDYGTVDDSASLWSFMTNSSPIFSAYIGASLYDFIGLELELRRSSHKMKLDKTDGAYSELSRWNFNRYEMMFGLLFMAAYMPHKDIELKPYAMASIFYSFYTEDIALADGAAIEDKFYFDNRFQPEKFYGGVGMTLGLRTAFFKNYAINLRAGIFNQSMATYSEEPIGISTTDGFIGAALEYHIRWIY